MTPSNDNRPASFDAELVRCRRPLMALALKLYGDSAEDLVQDTLALALRRWRSYDRSRPMFRWLGYMMRHIRYEQGLRHRPTTALIPDVPVLAPQEHAASISMMLAQTTPRVRLMLLMHAAGWTLDEVGAEHGVTRQRVHEIVRAERAALCQAANDADTRRDVAYGRAA